jgi:hypothetical protein
LLLRQQKARQSSFNVGFTFWKTAMQSTVTQNRATTKSTHTAESGH